MQRIHGNNGEKDKRRRTEGTEEQKEARKEEIETVKVELVGLVLAVDIRLLLVGAIHFHL
jgi:hypothetical protein